MCFDEESSMVGVSEDETCPSVVVLALRFSASYSRQQRAPISINTLPLHMQLTT
jgi:hypothetical protein